MLTWRDVQFFTSRAPYLCCSVFASSAITSCAGVLAWLLPQYFDEGSLRTLEALAGQAKAKGPAHLVAQHRDFGQKQNHHVVTFIHQVVPNGVLDAFWQAGCLADIAAGWNVSSAALGAKSKPSLRCMEAIDYYSNDAKSSQSLDSKPGLHHGVDWHHDGQTLLTVAALLSEPGRDFDGGLFEIRNSSSASLGTESVNARRGDAIVWRGWYDHRITKVHRGQRRVIVAEWWTGIPLEPNSYTTRESDTSEGLRLALRLDPASSNLQLENGRSEEEVGNIRKATARFQAALKIDPHSSQAHRNLAYLYLEQGNSKKALARFDASVKLHPQDVHAHSMLGFLHSQHGRLDRAAEHYREAVRMEPQSAKNHYNLGRAHFGKGLSKQAARCYRMAIQINPNNVHFYTGLGEANLQLKQWKGALASLQKALDLDPQNLDIQDKTRLVRSKAKQDL